MNKVQELLKRKRFDVTGRKKLLSVPEDDRRIRWGRDHFRLITEIKRSSPSAGSIRQNLDPVALAKSYERAGAAAISVLTEEHYFGGSLEDLRSVRKAVALPLLQKDFIVDEFQILEAKQAGADFVLLIVRFLTREECSRFLDLCREIKLNAIVEITNEEDLEKVPAYAEFVGVNARDLDTLEIDTSKFAKLRKLLPDAFLIAESGISSVKTVTEVMDLQYHGALIGEHLLRSDNPESEAARFVRIASSRPKIKICGITNENDARLAIEHGADALGFIFAESPRKIDPEILPKIRSQIPESVLAVGVFRGQSIAEISDIMRRFSLDIAQVYDPLKVEFPVWHARIVENSDGIRGRNSPEPSNILWDIKASGAEQLQIWQKLGRHEVFALAGGLSAENVADAIRICSPKWVDVARGVESGPGIKDKNKLLAFIKACGVFHGIS